MRHATCISRACVASVLLAAACVRSETVQFISEDGADQIGTNGTEEASGAFTVGEQASSGEGSEKCYAGLLGRCLACDTEGSCLCAKWYDGHSDYVPMDRSRWGQRIVLCPNQEIIIYILLSLVAALTTEAIWCILRATRFQHEEVKQNHVQWQQYPPLLTCYAALLGTTAQLTFVVLKLADPTQLLGINVFPSVLHVVRTVALLAEVQLDGVYYLSVQMRAQERSIGRQRVQDIVKKELRSIPKQVGNSLKPLSKCRLACMSNKSFPLASIALIARGHIAPRWCLQIFAATAASAITVLGAILTTLGYIESVQLHVMMMLTAISMENLTGSYFVLRTYIAARRMRASFDKCIEAVQVWHQFVSGQEHSYSKNVHVPRMTNEIHDQFYLGYAFALRRLRTWWPTAVPLALKRTSMQVRNTCTRGQM
eukprot:6202032-Pleurochrysis_carterae.AAC.3